MSHEYLGDRPLKIDGRRGGNQAPHRTEGRGRRSFGGEAGAYRAGQPFESPSLGESIVTKCRVPVWADWCAFDSAVRVAHSAGGSSRAWSCTKLKLAGRAITFAQTFAHIRQPDLIFGHPR